MCKEIIVRFVDLLRFTCGSLVNLIISLSEILAKNCLWVNHCYFFHFDLGKAQNLNLWYLMFGLGFMI